MPPDNQPIAKKQDGGSTPSNVLQFHAGKSDKIRLGNVDLIRFFAAMMVVLYHFTYTGHAANGLNPTAFPELLPLTQHRWVGAWLFFIVSGFGVSYAARHNTAYRFLVGRFARIYPTFLFCMCTTTLVLLLFAPNNFIEFQMTFARWFANLTMAPMVMKQSFVDGVYWSIVVEVIFYLGVGLFLACGLFHKRQLTILTVWLALSLCNEFWLENQILSKLVTRNSCFFALGMLSYRVFEAKRKPELNEIGLGAVAIILALKSDHTVNAWLVSNLNYAAEWNATYAFIKTIGFVALLNIAVRIKPVINASKTELLGGLTYPLYLLHSIIGFVLFHQLNGVVNRWIALALIFTAVMGLAYCVSRFVEPKGRSLIFALSQKWLEAKTALKQKRLQELQAQELPSQGLQPLQGASS